MKKVFAILLAAVMALALVSCGASDTAESTAEEAADAVSSTAENSSKTEGYKLRFGELVEANPNGGADGKTLVIKAKIESQMSNKQTIQQNYFNIEDIVKEQGGDKFEAIDYWAVADMSSGSESKVVSFTIDKTTIQGIKDGNILPTELGDYANDLWIHPSLQ